MDITKRFEDRDSFIHWFIIATLSGVEITENMRDCPRNLTMQLNGEDVNPENAIDRLEEEFNRMVEQKAKEMLDDMRRDILQPFEEKVEEMTGHLDELITSKLAPTSAD